MSDIMFATNTVELRAIERALTAHIDELNAMAARQGFLPLELAADRASAIALRNRIMVKRAKNDEKRTIGTAQFWPTAGAAPAAALAAHDVPDHDGDDDD